MTAIPSAARLRRPRLPLRRRRGRPAAALLVLILAASAIVGVPGSLALFTDQEADSSAVQVQSIFSDERSTTAFDVNDRSSGTDVDVSSPLWLGSDGLTTTTSAWSTSYAADRYVEFDLNDPLPAALSLSSVSFTFRFASGAADTTACYYFEVRRASTGEILDTHGSSGNQGPVACVTGSAPSATTTAIPSVASTTISNDLRIRIYAKDSGGNGMIVDRAVVTGTLYDAFTLYPVRTVDAADTTASTTVWELDGP